MPEKLVEVIRGNIVESVHYGTITVVDSSGRLLHAVGDPERVTFFRSSAKPLLAIAALECGIAEEYNLDLKDIALMASSHSGEKEHIETLQGMLQKVSLAQEDLHCGAAAPVGTEAAEELAAKGLKPTSLHCNCSGKHIGLLAACKLKGMPLESYLDDGHEIQRMIDLVVSRFSGVGTADIEKGIDGCGTPVHAVPIKNIALAYANLCDRGFYKGKYTKSQNYVLSAMTLYPEMVGGKDRLDTLLMKDFGDRVLGKFGAEGVHCMAILNECTGISIKIEDGNQRGVSPVVIELLYQLGVLNREEASKLNQFWNPIVTNHKGEKVGELRPVFKI